MNTLEQFSGPNIAMSLTPLPKKAVKVGIFRESSKSADASDTVSTSSELSDEIQSAPSAEYPLQTPVIVHTALSIVRATYPVPISDIDVPRTLAHYHSQRRGSKSSQTVARSAPANDLSGTN
jgi:hypothetical protein